MATNWLKLAQDAYDSSTSYVDANYRKKWDDALRMFQSRHPQDSKYNTETYKHRSKVFRPKSRSLVRKHEAAVAAAFFSNLDVISTSPVNQDDPNQSASAALMKEIIQYRLTKSVPWFQIVCGGMQDAMNVGVVCSYQYWKYKEEKRESVYEVVADEMGQPLFDMDGNPQIREVKQTEVIEDRPCVELIPVENIRFDPGADWTNPAASSPYLIRMIPMYVVDLKAQMEQGDSETNKKWKKLSDGDIRSAQKQDNDQTRQTREKNRQDSTDTSNAPISDFEIVWVHENFMRIDGSEKVYYTLGTQFMLTDPVPLKEVYFHNERPIVIGNCVIETHKTMPDSPVLMAEQLQREVNEIANQRIDNVKLVLNKRYFVKRGAQVDLKSIVRNVPGSVTLANDPASDIREMEFNDVTGSSYQEQDRLNVDYDELTGNFSQGSVMTNRKMGETVGGMGMISQAANQVTEYTIRTFVETWAEPVLRQLVKLEQKYETDTVILAIAAGKAKLMEQYGISQITDELLNQELTLTVNVGMGATDPNVKLQKFIGALTAFGNVAALQIPSLNVQEVGKEIFGLAGYRDGVRFVGGEGDGQDAQMQQMMQQVQQEAQQMVQQAKEQLQQKEQAVFQQATQMSITEKELQNQLNEIQNEREQLRLAEQLAMQTINDAKERLNLTAQVKDADNNARESQIQQKAAERLEQIANAEKDAVQRITDKSAPVEKEEKPEKESSQINVNLNEAAKKKFTIKAPSGGEYTGQIESE